MVFNVLRFIWCATALVVFLLRSEVSAQTVPCGVPHEDSKAIFDRENRILKIKQQLAANFQTANHTVQYIPIKAHILRKTDGTGGLSLAELNTALAQINSYYMNVGGGVQFYFCGSPNFINNTTLFDYDNTEESTLCNANDVNNAINVYFPNTIQFGSLSVSGYAYFPSTLSSTNRVFVQASYATDARTLVHELGHYFNLLHTFQGSSDGIQTNREYVTRDVMQGANCSTKGDYLCDTPADSYGRDSVSLLGCSYTGTAKDPQGQLYAPMLSNIMSYYPIACGNTFTSGQYIRMSNGLLLRTDGANQYTLNCGPTVTGANVPGNLTGSLSPSGLSLTFLDNSSNETGFIIERSTTSTTEGFVPIGGVAPNVTTFLDPSSTAFTTYYYRVKASNSSSQYSPVFTITTALNYCIPTYSQSCNAIATVIDDFILKEGSTTIISNINSNCSANNYGDFTNTNYNLTAGSTYTFTARAVSGGSGTYFDQHVSIWLDFDQDGLFELAERVYRSDSLSMPRMNPTATGSFTVPSNVSGIIRMRVRSGFNSGSGSAVTDPCGNLNYGEAEDYQFNVSSVLPASITTGVVTPNPVCAAQSISVSFTTSNLSSSSYVAQLSDNSGNNFTNISTTGTSSPLSAIIPSNTATGSGYKVRVNSISPSVTGSSSSVFTINANPSSPSVTSPVNYCQNQIASSLSATGSNLKWYTVSSGGVGSSSAPTPNTGTQGTTSYWVSQTVSSCESSRSQIDVVVTASPSSPSVTTPINYCQNQIASSLSATGSNLKWYTLSSGGVGSSTAPIPNTGALGTISYWVSQTVSSCESSRSQIDVVVTASPSSPSATTPINYNQGDIAVPLTATGSNLKWYTVSSGGVGSSSAPTPNTGTLGSTNYYVSQTANSCESSRAVIQVNVNSATTTVACPTLKVYLEGNWNGVEMTTTLNQQGLLPGQTPLSSFGVPTPAGQSYNLAPWNYTGSETVSNYDGDVVDWVLVSLRENVAEANTTVYKTAALLHKTGTLTLQSSCPVLNSTKSYFVFIEHRTHIGAASHLPIGIQSNKITYDFTQQDSYVPSNAPASGQQKVGNVYCLFGGDCNKASFSEINANDASLWRIDNGKFARYQLTDYNLDGEVNANDDIIWRRNNGKYSGVIF